jgi:hypothetical protein
MVHCARRQLRARHLRSAFWMRRKFSGSNFLKAYDIFTRHTTCAYQCRYKSIPGDTRRNSFARTNFLRKQMTDSEYKRVGEVLPVFPVIEIPNVDTHHINKIYVINHNKTAVDKRMTYHACLEWKKQKAKGTSQMQASPREENCCEMRQLKTQQKMNNQ